MQSKSKVFGAGHTETHLCVVSNYLAKQRFNVVSDSWHNKGAIQFGFGWVKLLLENTCLVIHQTQAMGSINYGVWVNIREKSEFDKSKFHKLRGGWPLGGSTGGSASYIASPADRGNLLGCIPQSTGREKTKHTHSNTLVRVLCCLTSKWVGTQQVATSRDLQRNSASSTDSSVWLSHGEKSKRAAERLNVT